MHYVFSIFLLSVEIIIKEQMKILLEFKYKYNYTILYTIKLN